MWLFVAILSLSVLPRRDSGRGNFIAVDDAVVVSRQTVRFVMVLALVQYGDVKNLNERSLNPQHMPLYVKKR